MVDPKHLAYLMHSAEAWNKWRDENVEITPDFRGAYLCGKKLRGADLSEADFTEANLSEADLREVDLSGTNLSEADLHKADLRGAVLRKSILDGADLRGAKLRGADLSEAWLVKADLLAADFTEANLSEVLLTETKLSGAIFRGANLREANLKGAIISYTILHEADLSRADLSGADLSRAGLSGADLSGADLSKAIMVETQFSNANLTNSRVYGISAWDLVLDKTTQTGLIITKKGDPAVTVNDIEVAQFIYFMLENKKIRRVINALTSKAVLILGRFTKKRKEILYALRDKLSEMDYLPIIFDFEKPTDRDFTETVLTLACLSKFVIIDLTDPKCSPHEATLTIPNLKIPFLPIIQEGQREYAMFRDFKKYKWLCEGKSYRDKKDLIQNIKKLTDAAETKYLDIRDEKDNSSSGFTPL